VATHTDNAHSGCDAAIKTINLVITSYKLYLVMGEIAVVSCSVSVYRFTHLQGSYCYISYHYLTMWYKQPPCYYTVYSVAEGAQNITGHWKVAIPIEIGAICNVS